MIPIRDTTRSHNYPYINMTIIGVNIFVFLIQLAQGPAVNAFVYTYGLVPARYTVPEISSHFTLGQQVVALFSFMFLHGGFLHLLGNMWSLYIFGDNIEDKLGPLRYLLFYLLCGWVSGLSQLATNLYADIPTIGASGAIAGVMGAYFILYPRSKILTLVPIFFFPLFLEISAYYFLGIWLLIQVMSAIGTSSEGGGIAWWAHIGGFVFGMLALKAFVRAPNVGITKALKGKTVRKTTPRIQVVRTASSAGDSNLYGSIAVTREEARSGARKLVNIPWGFQKRLIKIVIPAGTPPGTVLRLKGLGKQADEMRGDLMLRVVLQE